MAGLNPSAVTEARRVTAGVVPLPAVLSGSINTDAGESIEQAIEAEAIAKKQVETAQQALEKAKVEAETKKIDAQAAADVRLIAAKAEADANNLISNSVTEQVLKKMEMEARLKHGWVEVNSTGGTIVQQP